MNIGVIGVGAMGAPMARNLQAAGHTVLAYDANPKRFESADVAGLQPAADVAEVASRVDLILTMTTDDDAMLSVVEDVARTVARRVRLFIDVSSTSLRATRNADQRLGAIGVTFLDAAVYGAGVAGAKAGTSPIVVSGPRAAFEEIAPAIDALGVVTYVGKLGSAKIVKILNNLLVGAFAAAAAEIIGVGRSAGLSLPLIVDSMKAGSGSSYVLERYYGNYLESGAFGLGLIPISYMVKDLTLACDLAQEVRMPATMTEAARQLYQVARGLIGDVPFPQIYDLFAAVDHFDPGARA